METNTTSAQLEGLRRTMSIAAPLMYAVRGIQIEDIELEEYYRRHLVRAMTPGTGTAIPSPGELPDRCYQMTCELGGLCMELLRFPDIIWPAMSTAEKERVVSMLSAWGHHRTHPQNWRFFNIMMLTFLKKHGYPIDEGLMESHLDHILSLYAGYGFFDDGHYDYYSVYVMNLYAMIWCRAWGDTNDPQRVERFESIFSDLMKGYPYFFGRNGHVIMWARSVIYRLAVAGGLPAAFFSRQEHLIDPGWARRLCSGALLQFVTRTDFYENDIPSLGFYGHREYLLQSYSCSASPLWMFMPFLSLALPPSHPFWVERENEGVWEALGTHSKSVSMNGPGIAATLHGATGTAELRTGKVLEPNPNYNRICYNSHFPWEADDRETATAMSYSYRNCQPNTGSGAPVHMDGFYPPSTIYFIGERNRVLYRQLVCAPYRTQIERKLALVDLAEIIVPGGSIHIIRDRIAGEHALRLGHFGLPHTDGTPPEIDTRTENNVTIQTAAIDRRQTALVAFQGWERLDHGTHNGCNAEAESSTVLYAHRERINTMPSMGLAVAAVLHKTDNTAWNDNELLSIKSLKELPFAPSGSPRGASITLIDGSEYTVDFGQIDGCRMC
jgi:hypothetical protein